MKFWAMLTPATVESFESFYRTPVAEEFCYEQELGEEISEGEAGRPGSDA